MVYYNRNCLPLLFVLGGENVFDTSRYLTIDTEFMREDYNQCADINRIVKVILMGIEDYKDCIKYIYLSPSNLMHMKLSRIKTADIYVVYCKEKFNDEFYKRLEEAEKSLIMTTSCEFGTVEASIHFVPDYEELKSAILIYSNEFPKYDTPPLTQSEVDLFYELLCDDKDYKIFIPNTWTELSRKCFILKYNGDVVDTVHNIYKLADLAKVKLLPADVEDAGLSCCPIYVFNNFKFRVPFTEITLKKLDNAQIIEDVK